MPENITPFIYNSSSVRESEIPSNGEKVGKEEHQEDILLEAVDVKILLTGRTVMQKAIQRKEQREKTEST